MLPRAVRDFQRTQEPRCLVSRDVRTLTRVVVADILSNRLKYASLIVSFSQYAVSLLSARVSSTDLVIGFADELCLKVVVARDYKTLLVHK